MDRSENFDSDFGKERDENDVLKDIKGWVDWFEALNDSLGWVEASLDDLRLLQSPYGSFYTLPSGNDPNHKIGRLGIFDILVVSSPAATSIIGHSIRDPM